MLKKVLAVSAALVLSASDAAAQRAVRPCVADVATHCASVAPGEGRVGACLKEHVNDLSAPCQNWLAFTATAAKVCRADVRQHCADARGRRGRVDCLKSTLANLSDDCKSAISRFAAHGR